jgi:chromosome partitioning protein
LSEIISITNQKGGVGKTTTAVNLSAALAKAGFSVLLIDFDPQGHATEHLGVKQEFKNHSTILEVITKQVNISQAIINTYIPNLKILSSNLKLGKFNQISPQGNQFLLKDSLELYKQPAFNFIIIDCQPSLSLLTLNALTASTSVLLPVQAEFLALDGLTQLILTLKDVQTKLHPKLYVIGILLTMFDGRNRLSSEVQNELRNNFDKEVFETIIPRNIKLAEAPSFGKAIFDYDNSCNGAKSYLELAKEVADRSKLK